MIILVKYRLLYENFTCLIENNNQKKENTCNIKCGYFPRLIPEKQLVRLNIFIKILI